jgi:prolipoprotein diacylglyceryltransferase
MIAAILVYVLLHYARRAWWRDGYALALYLVLYGVVRLAIESMRTDSLYIGPWPAAYWLSGALIISGCALALYLRPREVRRVEQP